MACLIRDHETSVAQLFDEDADDDTFMDDAVFSCCCQYFELVNCIDFFNFGLNWSSIDLIHINCRSIKLNFIEILRLL